MKLFPEWGRKSALGYCSSCGNKLKETDEISKQIKSIMDSGKSKLAKKIDFINLRGKGIRHDDCEKEPKFCPYDGSELIFTGSSSNRQDGNYATIVCGECKYLTERRMTPNDECILKILHSYPMR